MAKRIDAVSRGALKHIKGMFETLVMLEDMIRKEGIAYASWSSLHSTHLKDSATLYSNMEYVKNRSPTARMRKK
jgi:hypothetical protein